MNTDISRDFDSLPPEAQKQVMDFIAFLQMRYTPATGGVKPPAGKAKATKMRLVDEPFIGMWKNREDMRDSARWVRETREREWGNR
jgi:hypothetical protein